MEEQRGAEARGEEETKPGTVALDRSAKQNERIPDEREEVISQAMFRLAESYEKLGKRAEAIAAYRKYVDRSPQGEYLSQAREKVSQMKR